MNREKKWWLIIGIVSFVLFLVVMILVTNGLFSSIDNVTSLRVINSRMPLLTNLFLIYHYMFETSTLIIISLLMSAVFYFNNKKKEALTFSGLMIIDGLALQLFKNVTAIARPIGGLVTETSYSFPSGHATSGIVFIGLSTYIAIKYFRKEWHSWKTSLILEMLALCIFVAYSRIYLGVHLLSDIIGGILLGMSILAIGIFILKEEGKK